MSNESNKGNNSNDSSQWTVKLRGQKHAVLVYYVEPKVRKLIEQHYADKQSCPHACKID